MQNNIGLGKIDLILGSAGLTNKAIYKKFPTVTGSLLAMLWHYQEGWEGMA